MLTMAGRTDENDSEFTPEEMRTILFSPPVRLDSVSQCSKHRETLTLGLERCDKVAIDTCLASMLNTPPRGCVDQISEACLGKIVCKIALATPVPYTHTAKRLAMILLTEWMRSIRDEHNTKPTSVLSSIGGKSKRTDRQHTDNARKRQRKVVRDALDARSSEMRCRAR